MDDDPGLLLSLLASEVPLFSSVLSLAPGLPAFVATGLLCLAMNALYASSGSADSDIGFVTAMSGKMQTERASRFEHRGYLVGGSRRPEKRKREKPLGWRPTDRKI